MILGPLLLANLVVTWYLIGLIWLVQRLTYPAFALVGRAEWPTYHQHHIQAITPVVAPVMLLQLALAATWSALRPQPDVLVYGALVLAVWLVTFAGAVPLHRALARDPTPALQRRLVRINWLRTALWSLQGLLLIGFALSRLAS